MNRRKRRLFAHLQNYPALAAFHFFFILILGSDCAIAQQQCHTHEQFKNLKNNNPARYQKMLDFQSMLSTKQNAATRDGVAAAEIIYTIPVVVHVMHNNKLGSIGGINNVNITDAQIKSQIAVLNEDFRKKLGTNGYNTNAVGADVMLEFCLADVAPDGKPSTGINRVLYGKDTFNLFDPVEETKMKAMSYWPSDKYLNIWVVNIAGDILGSAQYPYNTGLEGLNYADDGAATDGIVIHYQAFGRIDNVMKFYNLGRTTTHEIGHWLGLFHIWGDEYCGNDFVSDTPPQAQSNKNLSTKCPATFSKCGGIVTTDMNNNYMDYSPDVCMNIFTLQQKQRMRTALAMSPRRASLLKNVTSCTYLPSATTESIGIAGQMNVSWSNGNLYFSSEVPVSGGKFVIYSMLGETIWEGMVPAFDTAYTIALPNNSKGVEVLCMLVLETNQGKITRKLMPANK